MGDPAVVGVVGSEDVARLDLARLVVLRRDHLDRLVEHSDEGGDARSGAGDLRRWRP